MKSPFQHLLKKAIGYPSDIFARIVWKAVPVTIQGMGLATFVGNIPTSPTESSGKDNREKVDGNLYSDTFEARINAVDAELYQPFMMHMEGYRDYEIAEYLGMTESEVAVVVLKVKDLLKGSANLPLA